MRRPCSIYSSVVTSDTNHAEKADALEARSAAAEEAEDSDAAAESDYGDRKLIDGE